MVEVVGHEGCQWDASGADGGGQTDGSYGDGVGESPSANHGGGANKEDAFKGLEADFFQFFSAKALTGKGDEKTRDSDKGFPEISRDERIEFFRYFAHKEKGQRDEEAGNDFPDDATDDFGVEVGHVVFCHGQEAGSDDNAGHPKVLYAGYLVAEIQHAQDDQADDATGSAEGLYGSNGEALIGKEAGPLAYGAQYGGENESGDEGEYLGDIFPPG